MVVAEVIKLVCGCKGRLWCSVVDVLHYLGGAQYISWSRIALGGLSRPDGRATPKECLINESSA
jgi:hypothetical protein